MSSSYHPPDAGASLEQLARAAVKAPGWRWLPGMLTQVFRENGPDSPDCHPPWRVLREGVSGPYADPASNDAPPDLADPATLGCVLALVRERLGKTAVVRKVGVQIVDGEPVAEWAICDTLVVRDGVSQCGPSFYGFRSEVEALVAGLWVGGGL